MEQLKRMNNNILLIVEGSRDEQNIFSDVFLKYGFSPIVSDEKMDIDGVGQFDKYEYSLNNSSVVIIQGPKNRIHDFLKMFNENEMSIEKAFSYAYAYFSGIFLIYDVDHNDCDDVEEMYNRFCDESTGMLLLSSPCIEVIGDYNQNRTEETYHHLSEYKADINSHYNGQAYEFIKNNFEKSMLYYLKKNYELFNESNIMEHPKLIVEWINKYNDRVNCKNKEESYVVYRYFSTVVYVSIAYANGLTKKIDNYNDVVKFLSDRCCEVPF